jgi:S1-C subfamily serine protease
VGDPAPELCRAFGDSCERLILDFHREGRVLVSMVAPPFRAAHAGLKPGATQTGTLPSGVWTFLPEPDGLR